MGFWTGLIIGLALGPLVWLVLRTAYEILTNAIRRS